MKREWTAVSTHLEYRFGMLSGSSIFVEGFIYTPWGGFVAHELVRQHDSVFLTFSWRMLDKNFTCFASVCKDNITDCIAFCVVHGFISSHSFSRRQNFELDILLPNRQRLASLFIPIDMRPNSVALPESMFHI